MSELARFIVESDGEMEPTLWLVVGDAEPQVVLSRTDLRYDMRHLWTFITERIVGGRP